MVRKIKLITTGGTIGEMLSASGGRQHLNGETLLSRLSGLQMHFTISTLDLFDIPSHLMTFTHWMELAKAVDQAYTDGNDAVVITHGTDTLEEAAYFLDLVCKKSGPIVFTGAMRRPDLPGADGSSNLLNALLIASSLDWQPSGVLVTMNGEIHCAQEVIKANSVSLAGFKSPEFGPIGVVENNRIIFHRSFTPHESIPISEISAKVEGLKCYADMSQEPLRALIGAGFDGVVIETFGTGEVPQKLVPVIRDAIQGGMVVVATTRCPWGRIQLKRDKLSQGFPGDTEELYDAGVIFSDLPGPKARIKLAVCLSANMTLDELQGTFKVEWTEIGS